MTMIAPQTQTVRNQSAPKPDTDFLAQLQVERAPTAAPPAAPPASAPGNAGSVRIGGSGLNFPMSDFDPQAAPLVALLDAAFQSGASSVGGVALQEYGMSRARLEKTPDTLEEMAQYKDDIDKLVRMINIAGGEGMAVPDDIKKILEKWRQEESDPLMSQQPNDIPGLTRSSNGNVQFPTPRGPNSQQPAGGFPTSGNPFGFNAGGAQGASGAQGANGGGSATGRQLRDLLDKLGANDPSRDVYEILTEVIRDVIDNNAHAHPEKAAAVAEIARILSSANTGYANSSIPELLRITESPQAREAHSISVELARMQPDQVTSINQDGEKAVSFLKKSNGDYVMQALKPVHLRLPNGETARVEPFQAHSIPRGSVVTIPGMSPIEIGRAPREPTVIHPSEELGLTPRPRPSFNSETIYRPNPGQPVPPYNPEPADLSSSSTLPPPRTEPDFDLPPVNTESVVPDIGASNRRYDSAMTQIAAKLNHTPNDNYPTRSPGQMANDVAGVIDKELLPAERSFAGHMAAREAERVLSPGQFADFMEAFDAHRLRWQGGESGSKSDDRSMGDKSIGGSSSKPDLSSWIGNKQLIERLERIVGAGEKAGMNSNKLDALEKVLEMVSPR